MRSDTFIVGTVANPLQHQVRASGALFSEVMIRYPARLNAMALDPSQIDISENGVYTPGEIIFSVDLFKDVRVKVRSDKSIIISDSSPRHQLIRHAVLLMQAALCVDDGLEIDVKTIDLRHCGLGSSSGLIAAVATAINELYGKSIPNYELISYLAQNHGEEIDGNEVNLRHVQCIGGSAASGLALGGMKILAGQSVPIATVDVDESYTVLIGIPNDFVAPDAQALMELEIANMDKFILTGDTYRDKIGYRVTHETIPAMVQGDLWAASQLIFDYRFDYGSIENCSFVYPRMVEIAKNVRHLYEDRVVDTLALSSVGPAFFAITRWPQECKKTFLENDLKVFTAHVVNGGYQVINQMKP